MKASPNDPKALRGLIQAYSSYGNRVGLQQVADRLEALARTNPDDFQVAIGLGEVYRHLQKPDLAIQALDKAFNNPKIDAGSVLSIAQTYAALGNIGKLEATLEKLTQTMPENPEAWYDLAVLKCGVGKSPEAITSLRRAVDLSAKRLQADPKARDLVASARKEERFASIRQMPEFKQLVPPK